MAVKFFGQFLIKKGIISKMDLLHAIDLQEKNNLRFGDLVIKMGLMTVAQKVQTLEAQRHEDLQFGEMAIKLGVLTSAQVQQVLDKQRAEHLFIGEALVKFGVITQQQLERYLVEFKPVKKAVITNKIVIPDEIPQRQIWDIVTDMTCKMLTRVAGVTFNTGQCTITKEIPATPFTIEMALTGATEAKLLLTVSTTTIELLAKATLRGNQATTSTDSEIAFATKQFINIVSGNIVSKVAHLGDKITISQAEIVNQDNCTHAIPTSQMGLILPIHFSNGENLDLVIVIPKD